MVEDPVVHGDVAPVQAPRRQWKTPWQLTRVVVDGQEMWCRPDPPTPVAATPPPPPMVPAVAPGLASFPAVLALWRSLQAWASPRAEVNTEFY